MQSIVYGAICVTVEPDIDIGSAGSLDTLGVLTRSSIHLTTGIDLVSSETAKSVLYGLQLLVLYDTCRSHVISANHLQVCEICQIISEFSMWAAELMLDSLSIWIAKEVNSILWFPLTVLLSPPHHLDQKIWRHNEALSLLNIFIESEFWEARRKTYFLVTVTPHTLRYETETLTTTI